MLKARDSNYELLKIVAMLMIIMWHILCHGGVLNNSYGFSKVFFNCLSTFLTVHVNCFILITGYFQCKNKINLKKLLFLNNKAWFYRVIILLLFLLFSSRLFGKLEIIYNLLPIPLITDDAWFFKLYLVLYLLSPFLNKLIGCFDKKEFRYFLIVYGLLFSLLPTITNELFFFNNDGYSIQNFVFLYLIGAYLRNYPIDVNKNTLKLMRIFIISCLLNFIIYVCGVKLSKYSINVGSMLTSRIVAYDNPLVIVASIAFFQLFGTFKIKSKLINDIANLTFGIYLLHDNYLVRSVLYNFLGFNTTNYSIMTIIDIFCFSVIIFMVCMTIDYFVNLLFYKISQNKLFKKFSTKLYRMVFNIKERLLFEQSIK